MSFDFCVNPDPLFVANKMISILNFSYLSGKRGIHVTGVLLGLDNPWSEIAEQLGRDEEELKKTLDATVKRRNDIVHRADRSQDDSRWPAQEIGFPWAKQAVETIRVVCLALDDLVTSSTQGTSSSKRRHRSRKGRRDMDQEIRNKLRNVVTQCRKLLEDSVSQELEGKYGIFAKKDQVTADPNATMTHLTEEEQAARKDILDHFGHIKARGFKPKDALDQLVREIAFTHLNRLCAYKMMEAREVYVGGQKFREAVSRGINSNGVKFYLADHPEEERLFNTGHQDVAYRHFLDWLGGLLSDEIGVLFNPNDPANRLYPRQKTLDEVLDLLNGGGIKADETELREAWPKIWSQDETIGWVYQYFTPKELRDLRGPKEVAKLLAIPTNWLFATSSSRLATWSNSSPTTRWAASGTRCGRATPSSRTSAGTWSVARPRFS